MKKGITITGDILKANNQSFTEPKKEQFLDDFVVFWKARDYNLQE